MSALPADYLLDASAPPAVLLGEPGHEPVRELGLSLGDRICLTVAGWRNSTALTTDRRWSQVAGANLKIQVVR